MVSITNRQGEIKKIYVGYEITIIYTYIHMN